MAPSLAVVAAEVVRRAVLRPGERVLDLGTGTGSGAALARGEGRAVTGVDGAAGMLEIARRNVSGVTFVEADYGSLPFDDASFEVAMAVHSLHFAADPVAVLAEWLRVTAPGGRLSISVPGPRAATYLAGFDRTYRRYGVRRRATILTRTALARWARAAGWRRVATHADPSTVIRLADADAFGRWMRTGSRTTATAGWSEERFLAFEAELLALAPRADDGTLAIPFGSLFLTARR
jgi:SAM-dependent methyltransferase